ncbi:MAG: hypothetical protein ACK5AY_02310 [Bacteroidota bacterium]|jgi:hypothetical protein
MKKYSIIFIALLFFSCREAIKEKTVDFLNSEIKNLEITSSAKTDKISSDELPEIQEDDFDCPPEGNAKPERVRKLNKFKNRTNFPKENDFNLNITLKEILKPGNDENRWKNNDAARIVGYVYDVKPGGIETTNCKSKDKSLRDTHIEIVLNPMSAKQNEVMIVEITPRIRAIMKNRGEDWSTSMVRSKFLGRWVEFEGWMLFDLEHDNMAENTRPGNPKNWRATGWEIHPVTSMKVTNRK